MATMQSAPTSHAEDLSWYLNHARHSVWDHFKADQQQQMVEDNLAAGRTVSLVLFSLITAGLLMSIATVLVVWATI